MSLCPCFCIHVGMKIFFGNPIKYSFIADYNSLYVCACVAVVFGVTYVYNTKASPGLKYLFDKKFLRHETEHAVSYL